MCGIAGLIVRRGRVDVDTALGAMSRALAHRGPDGDGAEVLDVGAWRVGLAHRRLAIINPTPAGAQPMRARDGRVIVYNGETYNYEALAADLATNGRANGTRTDTQVVMEAFDAWGAGGLARLRGMFAFALVDPRAQRLHLARDPFGIKPLYVFATGDAMAFASEVRALLASGFVPRDLDPDGVRSLLAFGSIRAPSTIVRDVHAIAPGDLVSFSLSGDALERSQLAYARPFRHDATSGSRDRAAGVARVRAALSDSVRHHLVSDVPVGVFLSGGLDSSAIVGLASGVAKGPLRTFTVVHDDASSEGEYARAVSDRFGTRHTEIEVRTRTIRDTIPAYMEAMDQPSIDGLNTYVVSRAVRRAGVPVALSGLGADELFAGYSVFKRARSLAWLRVVPDRVRSGLRAAGRTIAGPSYARQKAVLLATSDGAPSSVDDATRRIFLPEAVAGLAGHDVPPSPLPATRDAVNATTILEAEGYMANTLLRDADVMSMAHGLEVRVPFVDLGVVAAALDVPGRMKLGARRPKPLLLDAVADVVPRSAWDRPKEGFVLPYDEWLRTSLRDEVARSFEDADALARAGLDVRRARDVWRAFLDDPGAQRWAHPWAIHALTTWCARHDISASKEDRAS